MKAPAAAAAVCVSLYVWTVGMILLGGILAVAVALTFLTTAETADRFLKRACRFLLAALFIRVDVEGAENVPAGRTALFMSNHVSLFDVPVLEAFIPAFVRALEANEHFRWPLYGPAIRRFGNIPVRRESVRASARSMEEAGLRLAAGRSLVVMPEGGRTADGRMLPFKRMPFVLARQAGVDIVPIGLSGMYRLKSKRSWMVRPSRVRVKFGPAVSGKRAAEMTAEDLRDTVRREIEKLVDRP
jgi:1-acyl-sn-glycerol-3-phosphate acyltransferase